MRQTTTQEHKRKLNEMVTKYKETGIESYFDMAFSLSGRHLRQTAAKWANSCGIPFEELLSEGNYRFIKVVESYSMSQGDFVNVLSRALRNAYSSKLRSPDNKAEYTERYREVDGKEIDILEDAIIAGVTKDAAAEAEGLVFADQRSEMIASLFVGASDEMIATVRVFLAERSYSAAGEVLGVSHTTVKRRLESLAKKFDTYKFGQVSDYIEGVETIVS